MTNVGKNLGSKALITGGSKGIGRALALRLAQEGYEVAILARGQAEIDETLQTLRGVAPGRTFVGVSADVTDADAMAHAVQHAIDALGGLDLLVCNAGSAQTGYAHETSASVYQRMMTLNYLGHVHAVLPALPHLRSQGHGQVVLVASMLGFMGMYGYSAYAASKFAIAGFAQSLRQELLQVGVQVKLCYPPTTETPGLTQENETKPKDVWMLESSNSFSRTYSAEAVAERIWQGLHRSAFEILVGWDSRFIFWMSRHFPRLTRFLADLELKGAIQKVAAGDKPRT